MRKYIFIFYLFLIWNIASFSQTPDWAWARSAGGDYADWVSEQSSKSIATDRQGNVYVTGDFSSEVMYIDNDSLINCNIASPHYRDIFLIKYDRFGNKLWAKEGGGNKDDWSYSVAAYNSENIYITGWFNSPYIVFDNDTLYNTNLSGTTSDIFVTRYGINGNVVWAKSFGGSSDDVSTNITVDGSGNIYLTGVFASSSLTIGSNIITNTGGADVFIIKCDANGNIPWSKCFGGSYNESAMNIATDSLGNVFLTGFYMSSSINFGSDVLYLTGHTDVFIIKYDSSGNEIWARSSKDDGDNEGHAIATDYNGNVYIAGLYQGNEIIFGTDTLINYANGSVFIVKYDNDGNEIWAKSSIGESGFDDMANGITTDNSGYIYVTGGYYSGEVIFDNDTLTNIMGGGLRDIFLIKYSTNGSVVWSKSAGGIRDDVACSITKDIYDDIYIAGYFFSDNIGFYQDTIFNFTQPGTMPDVFITKLGSITTSINEIKDCVNISLFPNPSTGQINISCADIIEELKVADLFGRTVFQTVPKSNSFSLDLSNCKGLYLLSVKVKNITTTKKIVLF